MSAKINIFDIGGQKLIVFSFIELLNSKFFGVAVPVMLILTGAYFCFRLKFFHFVHPIKIIKELFVGKKGERKQAFRATALALAGTLGVGNMVGVASAIALGGFGAVFWMWISALLAMILKYCEIVLAIRHKDKLGKGSAMLYIRACIKGKAGKIFACLFAVFCVLDSLSMGSMIQINAASEAMNYSLKVPNIITGIIIGAVALFAMLKGSSKILSLTEKIVPPMTLGFIILSFAVIFTNINGTVYALKLIFDNAFSFRSGASGIFGFLLSRALRYGTMRGILSNEAGCGTSPCAHATSECKMPAKQGIWGVFEVFADTILLCSMTAIVIIINYENAISANDNYMLMTIFAYSSSFGKCAEIFLSFSVLFFALATILCWGYYGIESVAYLSGRKNVFVKVFIFVYVFSVIAGSVMSSVVIWEIADLAIGVMTLINLFVLICSGRQIKEETDIWLRKSR